MFTVNKNTPANPNNEDQLDSELDDLVEYYPVSTKVNSPKNNSPELIQPL